MPDCYSLANDDVGHKCLTYGFSDGLNEYGKGFRPSENNRRFAHRKSEKTSLHKCLACCYNQLSVF